jgi:hypothetical protein
VSRPQPAPRPLAEAAAKRTLDAEQRVRSTLRQLDADGAAVSFAKVAERAREPRVPLRARRATQRDRGAAIRPRGRAAAAAGPSARERHLCSFGRQRLAPRSFGEFARTAWVSVEREERDPQRSWLSVLHALRSTDPGSDLRWCGGDRCAWS